MEQEHRTKILSKIDRLVKYTKFDILVRACLHHQLLSEQTVDNIQLYSTEEARHRKLIETIASINHVPNAYEIFKKILEDRFPDAHEILTHVSYRDIDTNDNAPSIRRLLGNQFGNLVGGQAQMMAANINNNNNNNNNNNDSNSTNDGIIISCLRPSTSRSISPFQPSLTNQMANITITTRPLPNTSRKLEIVEYKNHIRPELSAQMTYSTYFHGENASKVGVYPMRSQKRGALILVNNINFMNRPWRRRNGAEIDRDNLVHLFRQMGFFVCVKEDMKRYEFLEFLANVINHRELRDYDCFVLAVLSHGEHNEVEFVDGHKIDVEDILVKFNHSNCPHLIGKPKIFLFPFCRGPLLDEGVTRRRTENVNTHVEEISVPSCSFYDMKICYASLPSDQEEESWVPVTEQEVIIQTRTENDSSGTGPNGLNIATFYDMKICYSTVPGYNAFRDPVDGSWYVQVFCKVFAEHAHDTHLEDLLKIIGEHMNIKRTELDHLQTVSNEDRGFNKILYFNPGFYG